MSQHKYKNFIRGLEDTSPQSAPLAAAPILSGRDAQRLYLEELASDSPEPPASRTLSETRQTRQRSQPNNLIQRDAQLFLAAQNNDHAALMLCLNKNPQKLNLLDNYGWSLLMVACQANSVETVKELLKLGADISVRDKAGNSANTLLIKQRNVQLIDIMLNYKSRLSNNANFTSEISQFEQFQCAVCQKTYRDRKEHISSTEHNINMSKCKTLRTWYGIPESNRGFQILVKSGWHREKGLGPDGSGKKYPIKPVMKLDRKGIGAVKIKKSVQPIEEKIKNIKCRKMLESDYQCDQIKEKNFRREFY